MRSDKLLAARAYNVLGDLLTCSALNEDFKDEYTSICIEDSEKFLRELRDQFGQDELISLNGLVDYGPFKGWVNDRK